MDVQITPEPTPEEREAIVRALELEERATAAEPTAWQELALGRDAAAPEPGRGAGVIQP